MRFRGTKVELLNLRFKIDKGDATQESEWFTNEVRLSLTGKVDYQRTQFEARSR